MNTTITKFAITIVFLTGVVTVAVAQVSLSANVVYGSYKMAEMKDFQRALIKGFALKADVASQFPSNWSGEISARVILKDYLLIGGSLGFGSSKGKFSYHDNQGSLASDQNLTFVTLSAHLGVVEYFSDGKVMMTFDLQPGFVVSEQELKIDNQLNGGSSSDDEVYSSVGIKVQPTVSIIRRWRKLGVNCFAGYYANFTNSRFEMQDQSYLIFPGTDKSVHPDWSGFRVGAGVTYFFRSRRSQ